MKLTKYKPPIHVRMYQGNYIRLSLKVALENRDGRINCVLTFLFRIGKRRIRDLGKRCKHVLIFEVIFLLLSIEVYSFFVLV